MPRFKTHSAFVAALAIDLEKTGIRSTEARKRSRDRPKRCFRFREKKRGRNATPTNRPSFDRKKAGLNPSQVRRIFWA
jgi:tRNA 2-selenouridine synthase SelU